MEDPRRGPRLDPELFRALKFFGTISLDLASGSILGFLIGRYIDVRYGTEPFWTSFGFLGGAGVGFYGVFKLVTREIRRDWGRSKKKNK